MAIAVIGTLVNTIQGQIRVHWRASFGAFIFFGFIAVLAVTWVLSPSQALSQAVWTRVYKLRRLVEHGAGVSGKPTDPHILLDGSRCCYAYGLVTAPV